MDRIDAMKVFVSAVDEGSLAGAGRRLRRSPAAVSRAIAFLEAHVGADGAAAFHALNFVTAETTQLANKVVAFGDFRGFITITITDQ